MKTIIFTLILATLTLAMATTGCRSKTKQNTTEEAMTMPVEKPIVVIPGADGKINMALVDGRGEMPIRKAAGQQITVEFSVDGYSKLHAGIALKAPAEGNLRISTITLPDGKTDGPFGRDVDCDLPKTGGKVSLRIGENQMQGDPWAGDFTITVRLTK